MKRWLAAVLIGLLAVPPAYALRARGADAEPLRREIAGGLEESGRATASHRSITAMTILQLGLSLMGIPSAHQSAVAAARILPDTRDLRVALDTAIQLVGAHPLESWVYRPREVTVAQQARFSEHAEVLRRRFRAVFDNGSASTEALVRALMAVTDGPYEGNLDYDFLMEYRIPNLVDHTPTTVGDQVRLVRAVRLATILGLGGDTMVLQGVSNEMSAIRSRLEKLTGASGLEENPLERVTLNLVGQASYDAVILGPGVPSLGLVAALAYQKSQVPFRVIANPQQARAIVALIREYRLDRHLPEKWETEWILGGAEGQFKNLVQVILAKMRAKPGFRKILVIRGSTDPQISNTKFVEDQVVWNFSNDKSLRSELSALLDGYGLEIGRTSLDRLMGEVQKIHGGLEELGKQA